MIVFVSVCKYNGFQLENDKLIKDWGWIIKN